VDELSEPEAKRALELELTDRPESRLRVGDWRILVTLDEDNQDRSSPARPAAR
jgi:mRNA-degrading endonuclease RelE of RelBE toxin-antitoxin system